MNAHHSPNEANVQKELAAIQPAMVVASAVWAIFLLAGLTTGYDAPPAPLFSGMHAYAAPPAAQTLLRLNDMHEAYERVDREAALWRWQPADSTRR